MPKAPVTGGLALCITLLFAAGLSVPGVQHWLFEHLAMAPARHPHPAYLWQFLSYGLVHFALEHWLVNIAGIIVLGTMLEAKLAPVWYVMFLCAAAGLAALGHAVIYPASPVGLLGASGVVAALVGVHLMIWLPSKALRRALFLLAALAVLAFGIAALAVQRPLPDPGDISHAAHIAGLAFGIIWGGLSQIAKAR